MSEIIACSMWSHGYCPECNLYKKGCQGYPVKPKDINVATFKALKLEKRSDGDTAQKPKPKVTLRLIDVEHDTKRICTLEEAQTWDWSNPEIMRVIGDWQISSYEMLLSKLRDKEESGVTEVDLFEAPRFMMLSGG